MMIRRLTIFALLATCCSCVVKGNVPELEGNATCVPGYEKLLPSFCDWASSTDAIVVGKLTGLRWDRSAPVSLANGGDAPEDCPHIDGLLELQLDLTEVLRGPLQVGDRIAAIGQNTIAWRPEPTSTDPDRTVVQWHPAETAGLVLGQLLGVVLHKQPSGDRWGTYMEPFFIEEGGHVRFSKVSGLCGLTAPVTTGDYSSIAQFMLALDACSVATSAADDRRETIDAANTEWRAVCHDRTPVESGVDPQD